MLPCPKCPTATTTTWKKRSTFGKHTGQRSSWNRQWKRGGCLRPPQSLLQAPVVVEVAAAAVAVVLRSTTTTPTWPTKIPSLLGQRCNTTPNCRYRCCGLCVCVFGVVVVGVDGEDSDVHAHYACETTTRLPKRFGFTHTTTFSSLFACGYFKVRVVFADNRTLQVLPESKMYAEVQSRCGTISQGIRVRVRRLEVESVKRCGFCNAELPDVATTCMLCFQPAH